ncbi:hypothetical protein Vadar_017372 [Vaccinium darrowii]|uniref:Uncharacterized protein n=1 Tax=Vaccinium darrowii TaxID=229202 RepID=A0ACB7XIJ0_9ERIC|nr:hypothetical protein Vadar_017372 [Vaccinium darrowii]
MISQFLLTSLSSSPYEITLELASIQPCTYGNGKATADKLQQDLVMEFLQGLDEWYGVLRSQILLMDPFPSSIKIYSVVRKEEKQREVHSLAFHIPDVAALAAKSANRGNDSKIRKKLHCDHCRGTTTPRIIATNLLDTPQRNMMHLLGH